MKSAKFLLFVSILLLAACQPATPAPTSQPIAPAQPTVPTQAPPIATQETQPGAESYPAPPLNQGQAYPAPQTQAPSGQSGYPEPGINQAAMVTWEEAQNLILEGGVSQVTQLHDLTVILDLKDGTTVKTTEPAIDEVFKVIDQCGDPCSDIIRATE